VLTMGEVSLSGLGTRRRGFSLSLPDYLIAPRERAASTMRLAA